MSEKQISRASTAGVPSIGAQSSVTPSVPMTAKDVADFTSRISFAKKRYTETGKSVFLNMWNGEMSRFRDAGGVGDPTLEDSTSYVAPSATSTTKNPVQGKPDDDDEEWEERYGPQPKR